MMMWVMGYFFLTNITTGDTHEKRIVLPSLPPSLFSVYQSVCGYHGDEKLNQYFDVFQLHPSYPCQSPVAEVFLNLPLEHGVGQRQCVEPLCYDPQPRVSTGVLPGKQLM